MPKRTNDFQELVALIERSLAPQGAKVSESAIVTEDEREIDVLIESAVGPFVMKVAVEAKDEKRKMDISKFESIVAKYSSGSGIKVDKVVVVSRAGFSKKVVGRAEREGIELLNLKDALSADWAKKGPQKLHFSVQPHFAVFELNPQPIGELHHWVNAAQLVCTCCGRSRGTLMQLALQYATDHDLFHQARVAASRSGASACLKVEWVLPPKLILRRDGTDHRVDKLVAHIHCTEARTELAVRAYQRGDKLVHHLSGTAGGNHIQFVLPDGHASEKIAVKIGNAKASTGAGGFAGLSAASSTVPPLDPRIRDQSPEIIPVLERIVAVLSGIDASVEAGTSVHDFSTGQDVQVDALIKVRIGGSGQVRVAVAVEEGDPAQMADLVARWEKVAIGTEMDRIVVVTRNEGTDDSMSTRAFRTPVAVLPAHKAAAMELDELLPPVLLWNYALTRFEAKVRSRGPKLPKDEAISHFEIGKNRVAPQQFYDVVVQRILENAVDGFIDRQLPTSVHADGELRFDFRLPATACLHTLKGSSRQVVGLRGTATVRGLFAVLDRPVKFLHGGVAHLKYGSSSAGIPAIMTAALPRKHTLDLDQGPGEPTSSFWRQLPESLFEGLFGQVAPSDFVKRSDAEIDIATFAKSGDKIVWQLCVLSVSALRKLPSRWRK